MQGEAGDKKFWQISSCDYTLPQVERINGGLMSKFADRYMIEKSSRVPYRHGW